MQYKKIVHINVRLWPDKNQNTRHLSGTIEITSASKLNDQTLRDGIREALARLRRNSGDVLTPSFDDLARELNLVPCSHVEPAWSVAVINKPASVNAEYPVNNGLIHIDIKKPAT